MREICGIGVASCVRKVSVPADRILLGRVSGSPLGRISGGGDLSGSVRGGWVLPVGVFAGRVRGMNVLVSSVPGRGILGRSVLGGLRTRRVRRLGDLGRIRRSGWISLPGRFGRIGRVSALARRAESSAHGPTLEGRPRGRHVRPRRVPGLPDRRLASGGPLERRTTAVGGWPWVHTYHWRGRRPPFRTVPGPRYAMRRKQQMRRGPAPAKPCTTSVRKYFSGAFCTDPVSGRDKHDATAQLAGRHSGAQPPVPGVTGGQALPEARRYRRPGVTGGRRYRQEQAGSAARCRRVRLFRRGHGFADG